MTIKEFRIKNPQWLNNFTDDYFDNLNPTPPDENGNQPPKIINTTLKEMIKYFLNVAWLPTYDNFKLLVPEDVFMNHFISVLFDVFPNLLLSIRQHHIITSKLFMEASELIQENISTVSTNYSGFDAKGLFNEVTNKSIIDNKLQFLVGMNNDIKLIGTQLNQEIEKYLESFRAI